MDCDLTNGTNVLFISLTFKKTQYGK